VIFSPEQLLHRLDRRLDLLKGARDSDARHETLRATIRWSHQLLSEDEQRLFRHLAVFAGGCTLEAAEAVCDADPDTLQSLVDKSLVRCSDGRFLMLETIRAYAGDENERRHDDFATVERRHAGYYLAFAQQTKTRLSGPDRRRWVAARAAELENLRRALAWSIESGAMTLAAELSIAFGGAALVRTSEQRAWLRRVLDMPSTGDPLLRARTLKADGYAALTQGDYESARARFQASLPMFREADVQPELADALAGLAEIERIERQVAAAHDLYTEAIELSKRCGAQHVWRAAVFGLAHVEFDQQNYADSQELLLQLDLERMIWPLQALGDIAMAQGDFSAAARYFRRCVERANEEVAARVIVYGLAGLAAANARQGNTERAGRLWGAVETFNASLLPGLLPHDQSRYRADLERSRDDPAFAAGRAEGRSLSMHEAVALALERAVAV
jgi:tetratricopeptide (TPR) repeat protein